ncbi:protein AGENET DOMAIN (AGD)-CONTAINING P1-like [Bidens hawaiensis]|uniref:protein AGENET DOMAIN (AGD)-CONTAINING P1-like n=1 Tax=Bidens hawaiensis TaxID=980011 RepID=UPI00404B39F2
MKFKRGDPIEVFDMGPGFLGSFYDGNIISRVGKETYIVIFRTLLEADQSGLLRDSVKADKIRSKPADVLVSGFDLGEKVDVFANDGWWAGRIISKKVFVSGFDLGLFLSFGRIISKIGETEYLVHFDSTNQDIIYPFTDICVHRDWDAANEVWLYSRN